MARVLGCSAIAGVLLVAIVTVQNAAIAAYFPHLSRFTSDFSASYLRRELHSIGSASNQTVLLGDSVLWGYRVRPDQSAVALMTREGCACRNLSFKGSSPPNYYALTRALLRYGAHPRAVVVEIDQRVFNPRNDAYQKLYPPVESVTRDLLGANDRKGLATDPSAASAKLAAWAESISLLYGMRSDIRETLQPVADAVPVRHPTADVFLGEYDLTPLNGRNLAVRYLQKTVRSWRAAHVPILAFMTPTNHDLLRDYINGPEYAGNVAFLEKMLQRDGVAVLNLDRTFSGEDFYDNVHLKPAAQMRLAEILQRALAKI